MVTYRGYLTSVTYTGESAFGTPGTPSVAVGGKMQSITINQTNNLSRNTGLGEGRDETFVAFGNYGCTVSMEYLPGDWGFLQFGIGPRSGAGTAGSPYLLTESDNRGATYLNTATVECYSQDNTGGSTHNVDTFTSFIINTIGVSCELGGPVKVSLEGFAQKCISKATVGVTFPGNTTKPWMFQQGNFSWNGANVARVQSATININNNIDPDVGRGIGSRFAQEWEPGLRKYDFVLVTKMTDTLATTMRDAFYGQANSPSTGIVSAEPTFYDVILNFSEGTASTNRNAQILLENCSINDISKPISIGDNVVEVTINGCGKAGKTLSAAKVPFKEWTV